jgi:hypothetical protein
MTTLRRSINGEFHDAYLLIAYPAENLSMASTATLAVHGSSQNCGSLGAANFAGGGRIVGEGRDGVGNTDIVPVGQRVTANPVRLRPTASNPFPHGRWSQL